MKKQLIWLSYDLGINGDYPNLYSWLDSHNARECGDSMAAFEFEYQKNLVAELKQALKRTLKTKKSDRIYLIYKNEECKLKGSFIIGRRKPAPWKGYAQISEPGFEDEG